MIDQLVENPEQLNQLGGDLRVMTAYFSDVASFSTISENLTPVDLVVLLNEYLSEMCDIIAEHGGTIDKFEGDAIIAFWGAPLKIDDHARRALMATVDMQSNVAELRKKWETEGKMEKLQKMWAEQGRGEFFRVRMGINTGEMVVRKHGISHPGRLHDDGRLRQPGGTPGRRRQGLRCVHHDLGEHLPGRSK